MKKLAPFGILTLWLFCACEFAFAAPLSITLPDAGTYSYWVQAKSGTVSRLPATIHGKKTFALKTQTAGDTLFVLDAHSGLVAVYTLSIGRPVVLSVGDFHQVVPALIGIGTSSAVVPAKPAPAVPRDTFSSGLSRVITLLLGLAILGGVLWVLRQLVQKRGEPLIALARKAGVEVPDAKSLDPDADKPMPTYAPPAAPLVEHIPDEAGAAPIVRPALRRGPTISMTGIPQLVGLEGLAAGNAFALTEKRVSVGRDGDNGIVLAENTVSRLHALLTRDRQGQITLTDEGSANGIYVNGTRTERAILSGGDEVQIGDNVFRFEAGAS